MSAIGVAGAVYSANTLPSVSIFAEEIAPNLAKTSGERSAGNLA
jgi:hypothetical protein